VQNGWFRREQKVEFQTATAATTGDSVYGSKIDEILIHKKDWQKDHMFTS